MGFAATWGLGRGILRALKSIKSAILLVRKSWSWRCLNCCLRAHLRKEKVEVRPVPAKGLRSSCQQSGAARRACHMKSSPWGIVLYQTCHSECCPSTHWSATPQSGVLACPPGTLMLPQGAPHISSRAWDPCVSSPPASF